MLHPTSSSRARTNILEQLDDHEDTATDELERCLSSAIEILLSQDDNPELRFFRKATECMRPMIKWVCKLDHRPVPAPDTLTRPNDLIQDLHRALILFRELRQQNNQEQLQKAKRAVQATKKWVRALEKAESRRTMPKTNVRGAREPDPAITHGYHYRDRDREHADDLIL